MTFISKKNIYFSKNNPGNYLSIQSKIYLGNESLNVSFTFLSKQMWATYSLMQTSLIVNKLRLHFGILIIWKKVLSFWIDPHYYASLYNE